MPSGNGRWGPVFFLIPFVQLDTEAFVDHRFQAGLPLPQIHAGQLGIEQVIHLDGKIPIEGPDVSNPNRGTPCIFPRPMNKGPREVGSLTSNGSMTTFSPFAAIWIKQTFSLEMKHGVGFQINGDDLFLSDTFDESVPTRRWYE